MGINDRLQLATWLKSRATLAEVESASAIGLVGNIRFTPAAVRAFRLIWSWSAARFSGEAGKAQDRFYERCGSTALSRRMERARAHCSRLTS